MLIFQPCFSAKDHNCSKTYTFDIFVIRILANDSCTSVDTPLYQTCVWNGCFFYHCSNCTSESILHKMTYSGPEQIVRENRLQQQSDT